MRLRFFILDFLNQPRKPSGLRSGQNGSKIREYQKRLGCAMKIFSIAKLFLRAPDKETGRIEIDPRWLRDPLSHPDLEAMSLRQLADLPLHPAAFEKENADCCVS
jgi:hypothetical protein